MIRIDTLFIVNASIKLSNTNQFGTFLNEKFGSPIAYITETLNDKSFAFQSS